MKTITELELDFYLSQLSLTEGQIDDLRLKYLQQETGNYTGTVYDLELELFNGLGYTTGTIDDRWYNFLIDEGYTGNITDMERKYYEDNS